MWVCMEWLFLPVYSRCQVEVVTDEDTPSKTNTGKPTAEGKEKEKTPERTKDKASAYSQVALEWSHSMIPIVVFGCNRPSIKRSLDRLFKLRPSERFPILVSLDCHNAETIRVLQSYGEDIVWWNLPEDEQLDIPPGQRHMAGYYHISAHYKYVLHRVFDILFYDHVILLEDDMEVSADFFSYFEATMPLLYLDNTIMCVSSWNDQGKNNYVSDPSKSYRA